MKKIVFIVGVLLFYWSLPLNAGQNNHVLLSPVQESWLYHVVMRSPTLKRNMGDCFNYKGDLPVAIVNNDFALNFKTIETLIIDNPDILDVNYEKLRNTSNGILAELSTKLSLWELYNYLNQNSNNENSHESDSIYNRFYSFLDHALPDLKAIQKSRDDIITQLILPSLRIGKKIEILGNYTELTLKQQKAIFDTWNVLVKEFVNKRSYYYFTLFKGEHTIFQGHLIAAGEGSGSAGLLDEYEPFEANDLQSGNGKGSGLFTYDIIIDKNELQLHYKPQINLFTLYDAPTLLHFSLWGMNTDLKPTIVINRKNKTYLLYANYYSKEISPDPNLGTGKTYHDLLNDFYNRRIVKETEELESEGGLKSILAKEYGKKEMIINQIADLENEIKSIDTTKQNFQHVIDTKNSHIITYKERLRKKKEKISSLEQKITGIYTEIKKAEQDYTYMKAKLGDNIQSWESQDGIYLFEDSTLFNYYTQDFIFKATNTSEPFSIQLMAMGYNLFSKKIDEVQLYANITKGEIINKEKDKTIIHKDLPDFHNTVFYNSNEFIRHIDFDTNELKVLEKYNDLANNNPDIVRVSVEAGGIAPFDTIDNKLVNVKPKYHYRGKTIRDKNTSKNQAINVKKRKSEIQLNYKNDSIYISIISYTDPVYTLLTNTNSSLLAQYSVYKNDSTGYNDILSALRSFNAYENLKEYIDILETDYPKIKLNNKEVDIKSLYY